MQLLLLRGSTAVATHACFKQGEPPPLPAVHQSLKSDVTVTCIDYNASKVRGRRAGRRERSGCTGSMAALCAWRRVLDLSSLWVPGRGRCRLEHLCSAALGVGGAPGHAGLLDFTVSHQPVHRTVLLAAQVAVREGLTNDSVHDFLVSLRVGAGRQAGRQCVPAACPRPAARCITPLNSQARALARFLAPPPRPLRRARTPA